MSGARLVRGWQIRVDVDETAARTPTPRALRVVVDVALLAKDAGLRWMEDGCYRLAAALSYCALFSLVPLMLLCLTSVGFLLGDDDTVRQRLLASIAGSTSAESRALLDETLRSMQAQRTARGVGAIAGVATLLLAASGAFSELDSSLNLIWRVKDPPSRGVWTTIARALIDKALSFAAAVAAALALLASLVGSTALLAVAQKVNGSSDVPSSWHLVDAAASVGFLALVLAALYRIVPRAPIEWRDVFGAALLASFLFTALKGVFAWYFAKLGGYAAYGAVGGILGLLTWIYVVSLLLFYGAEWSRVYAERFGSLSREAASRSGSRPSQSRVSHRAPGPSGDGAKMANHCPESPDGSGTGLALRRGRSVAQPVRDRSR
jgi:membrane protein